MRKKYGIQLRGLGRALRSSGLGVVRPKPTGKGGKPLKPKPIRPGKKDGGKVKKKFPDLTGDGKVTRADVLKGRGVFASGGDVPARLRKGGPKQHQSRIPPHRKEQMKKEFKKYGGPRPKGSVGARTFKRDGGMPGLSKDLKKLKKLGIKKPSSEMQEKLTDKNFKRKKK
jgi:hypothetical protein